MKKNIKPLAKFNPKPRSAAEVLVARASSSSAGSSNPCQIKKIVIDGTSDQGPGFTCIGSPITLRAISDPTCPSLEISWKITTQPPGSNVSDPPKGETAIISPTKKGQYVIEADCDNSSASFSLGACEIQLDAPTQNQEFSMDMGTATTGPTMPKVTLKIADPCPGATNFIQCRFVIGDNNNVALKYENARTTGYDSPPSIDSGWLPAGTLSWDIDWGNNIYGGHITQITIFIMAEGEELCSKIIHRDIWILGGALSECGNQPVLFQYLETISGISSVHVTMLKAIARSETHTHHFSPSKTPTTFHKLYPVHSGDNGYGVFQLTNLSPDEHPPDRLQIWSWKANANAAYNELLIKESAAKSYLKKHLPYTAYQLKMETYSRYNGGAYYKFINNQWVRDPNVVCGCNSDPKQGTLINNPQSVCRNRGVCYADFTVTCEYTCP